MAAGLALVVLSGAGCRVTITTDVGVRRDGSGWVRVGVGLDRDAWEQVPDLARRLEVDDLRAAGWQVVGPRRERDGRTWVRAGYAFDSTGEARKALAALNGRAGPFRDFALTRAGSVFRSRLRLTGTVDLSAGLEGFGDAELARTLGAANPGVDAATLERRFGVDLSEVLDVRVSARLPGLVRTWHPRAGAEAVRIEASAAAWNPRAFVLAGVGALALLVGLALLVRPRRP
jgi:hypothetical protein